MQCHTEELIQQVYGFSLESMHSEAEAMLEHLQIAKAKFKKQQQESSVSMSLQPLHEREKSMRYDHLCTRMENGKYYSLNRSDGSSLAFQVICKHPERRAYVQRICLLGKDVSQLEQIMNIFLPVLYCIVLIALKIHLFHYLVNWSPATLLNQGMVWLLCNQCVCCFSRATGDCGMSVALIKSHHCMSRNYLLSQGVD